MRYVVLNSRAYEDWKRCPYFFAQKARLLPEPPGCVRPPRTRTLERWSLVTEALAAAHREAAPDIPDLELLRSKLGRPWVCTEEREEMLTMLDNYADVAAGWGGTFVERDDGPLRRKSSKLPVLLEDSPHLLFRHPMAGRDVVESRYVYTGRWEEPGEELDFRTAVRHLVLSAAYPDRVTRVSEVSLRDGRTSVTERDPGDLSEAGAVARVVSTEILADSELAPRRNYRCSTCEYAPNCGEIPGPPGQLGKPTWTTIAPSRLRDFNTCPRRYWLDSVLKLGGAETYSDAADLGNRIHALLAEAHFNGECSPSARWEGATDEERPYLETHARICPATQGAELLGSEVDLFWMDRSAGVMLSGRLDAIWKTRSGLEVRDHKTGIPPTGEGAEHFDASAYGLLAATNFSAPVRVGFEYLLSGEVRSTEVDLDAAEAEIRSRAAHLASATEFPAHPGGHCQDCKFRYVCPESEAA